MKRADGSDTYFFKFLKIFSMITIIGLAGALGQVAWWIWYPYDIVEFKEFCYNKDKQITNICPTTPKIDKFEGIVTNPNKKVKRGELLNIEVDFNKKVDIHTYKINRQLVNDRYVTLVCDQGGSLPVGKHKKEVSVFIPHNIFPGRYQLLNIYIYHPNPIKEVVEDWKSEWFEVIP